VDQPERPVKSAEVVYRSELVIVGVGSSGRVEKSSLLLVMSLSGCAVLEPSSGEDQGHRLDRQVAALDEPLISLKVGGV
jgi:hypothetical protein